MSKRKPSAPAEQTLNKKLSLVLDAIEMLAVEKIDSMSELQKRDVTDIGLTIQLPINIPVRCFGKLNVNSLINKIGDSLSSIASKENLPAIKLSGAKRASSLEYSDFEAEIKLPAKPLEALQRYQEALKNHVIMSEVPADIIDWERIPTQPERVLTALFDDILTNKAYYTLKNLNDSMQQISIPIPSQSSNHARALRDAINIVKNTCAATGDLRVTVARTGREILLASSNLKDDIKSLRDITAAPEMTGPIRQALSNHGGRDLGCQLRAAFLDDPCCAAPQR